MEACCDVISFTDDFTIDLRRLSRFLLYTSFKHFYLNTDVQEMRKFGYKDIASVKLSLEVVDIWLYTYLLGCWWRLLHTYWNLVVLLSVTSISLPD